LLLCVQYAKLRAGCSFCLDWWNWIPSMFKLYFHNYILIEAKLSFWAKRFEPNKPWGLYLLKRVQHHCILLIRGLQGLDPIYSYLFMCARLNMDALFRVHFNIHDHFLEIFVFSIKPIYNFSQLRRESQAYWAFISTTVNRPITKMVDVISLASSLKKCKFWSLYKYTNIQVMTL
jgi:hypothetical protein